MKRNSERADNTAAWFLVLIGVALIVDSFFVHGIYFKYETISMSWLDPFLNHWMWGVVCVVLGYWSLKSK